MTEKTTRELRIDPGVRDLLPTMPDEAKENLRRDIEQRGVVYPILVDDTDTIIDGHHRYEAARSLEPMVPYAVEMRSGLSDDEKRSLARAVNVYRRHMTAEQRRPVLVELRQQGYSTRRIAREAGVPEVTVRRELSPAPYGAGDHPERVTGDDGKAYPAEMTAPDALAERRQRVATLIERGVSQRAVAAQLGVAQSTVAGDWKALKEEGGTIQKGPERGPGVGEVERPERWRHRPSTGGGVPEKEALRSAGSLLMARLHTFVKEIKDRDIAAILDALPAVEQVWLDEDGVVALAAFVETARETLRRRRVAIVPRENQA